MDSGYEKGSNRGAEVGLPAAGEPVLEGREVMTAILFVDRPLQQRKCSYWRIWGFHLQIISFD